MSSRPIGLLVMLSLCTTGLAAAEPLAPKREGIEWLDVWVTHGDQPAATPRVLLIGDSITRAYYGEVQKRLEGKAVCDRLATSISLGDPLLALQIGLVVRQYHYDVIHFNNGMHGWGYSEAEYGAAILPILATLRQVAPDAKLVWATTTPTAGGAAGNNPRIDERNRLVQAALTGKDVVIDDLHAVIVADPTMISKDGVHMGPAGTTALADHVAQAVLAVAGTGKK